MIPTKALLDRLAVIFNQETAWSQDSNDAPCKLIAIVEDFTPSLTIPFADLTLNTAQINPHGVITAPANLSPGVNAKTLEYDVPICIDGFPTVYAAAITTPVTIFGWALVQVADNLISASYRYDNPITVTATGQIIPIPVFAISWPADFIR